MSFPSEEQPVCCTRCATPSLRPLLVKEQDGRGPGPVRLYVCPRCSLVFLGSGNASYDPDLYKYYAQRLGSDQGDLYHPLDEKRLRNLLRRLAPRAPGRRLLDVGCGQGHLLHVALQEGFVAEGIEVSASAVELCRSFGLPAHCCDLYSLSLQKGQYALCTLLEVVEHVPEPARFLKRVTELLLPGGLVYLTTPNFASLDRRLLGPRWRAINREHLSYFTPATLRSLAQEAGLEVLELGSRNLSIYALREGGRRMLRLFFADSSEQVARGSVDRALTRSLRGRIEGSMALSLAKGCCNAMLNTLGVGASLTALCRRPEIS